MGEVLRGYYKGVCYRVLRGEFSLLGYVDIPKLVDTKDADNIPVHGGLTYTKRNKRTVTLGWDYGHSGDKMFEVGGLEWVKCQPGLRAQLLGQPSRLGRRPGQFHNEDKVIADCKAAIDYLMKDPLVIACLEATIPKKFRKSS